jgi:hypothetical protein
LGTRRLDFGFAKLAKILWADVAGQQANDGDDNQQFKQCETSVSTRSGCAFGWWKH